jgi:hypothetical protein
MVTSVGASVKQLPYPTDTRFAQSMLLVQSAAIYRKADL